MKRYNLSEFWNEEMKEHGHHKRKKRKHYGTMFMGYHIPKVKY